jgi:hypothetical protein
MERFTIAAALALASAVLAAPGDTIRTFTLTGQPNNGVRGLAYDWGDGNVWAAGPDGLDAINCAKFNPTSASLVTPWVRLSGCHWVYDLGYGYKVGATRYLVADDRANPRLRLHTTAGSFAGSLPDPFTGGFNTGVDCDWGGSLVFQTNDSFSRIYRWSGSAWGPWAGIPAGRARGVATGWGRVLVVTESPDYKIYEYDRTTGSLARTVTITGWTGLVCGMSIGRVNALRGEESVFIGRLLAAPVIAEVSIGNITDTVASPASLGKVKTLFR